MLFLLQNYSLTLSPKIAFMPISFSLFRSTLWSSYSRNGRPSEISLAFNSPFSNRFWRQTYDCKKQPLPVVGIPSGKSIVVKSTSGTFPLLNKKIIILKLFFIQPNIFFYLTAA